MGQSWGSCHSRGVHRELAELRISDLPAADRVANFPKDFGQRFLLTVDTEEEFDWTAPARPRRPHASIRFPRLARFQQFCEGCGVVPVYLVDYPVATSPVAGEVLRDAAMAGQAEIGVQLHPWVNPPFDEEVSEFNSFAGNLPPELERAKFMRAARRDRTDLRRRAAHLPLRPLWRGRQHGRDPDRRRHRDRHLGARARSTTAMPAGPTTATIRCVPYWLDRKARAARTAADHDLLGAAAPAGAMALSPAVARADDCAACWSRLGMLERIPLTPEGVTVDEAIRGIDIAIDRWPAGAGVFVPQPVACVRSHALCAQRG